MDDLGRVRCVHRLALKARIQKDAQVLISTYPPVLEKEVPSAEVLSDVDLLMLVPTTPVGWGPVSQVPVSLGASTSQSRSVESVVGGR